MKFKQGKNNLKKDMTDTPRITLYEHAGYRGRSTTLTAEASTLLDHGFNDVCSSIKVEKGVWLLYEHGEYRGKMWVVWEGQVYDDYTKWADQNDTLSSLKPITVKTSDGSKCELFDDVGSSRKITLTEKADNFSNYAFNDTCSYINVISGTWVGYDNSHYTGSQILLEEGTHDLKTERGGIFNNRLSSIKPIEIDYPIKLLSIQYDVPAAVQMKTPKILFTVTEENSSSVAQRVVITQAKTVSVKNSSQFRWSNSHSVQDLTEVGIKMPFISADERITIGDTSSQEHIDGRENTSQESWTVNMPMEIPPHTRVTITSTVTEYKVNVPFTAKLQKGSRCWTEHGTWIGVQHFNFSTSFKEFPI